MDDPNNARSVDTTHTQGTEPSTTDDQSSLARMTDATGDPIAKSDRDEPEPTGPREGPGGREIVVPLRLYKTVTVFSTLVAIVTFILGFVLIDAATLQTSLLRDVVYSVLIGIGVPLAPDTLTAAFAIAGLGSILFGAAVYILGTRFRAQGMGKPQEDSNEE